jgi:hypothetical protein
MSINQNKLYFPYPVQPNQVVKIVVAYSAVMQCVVDLHICAASTKTKPQTEV